MGARDDSMREQLDLRESDVCVRCSGDQICVLLAVSGMPSRSLPSSSSSSPSVLDI